MASLTVDSLRQLLELLGQQGAPLAVVEAGFRSQFKPETFPLVVAALRAMWDQCYEQVAELQNAGESIMGYFLLSVIGVKSLAVRALLHQQLARLETLLRDGAFLSESVRLKSNAKEAAAAAAGGAGRKGPGAKEMQAKDAVRSLTVQKAFVLRCLLDTVDKSATVAALLDVSSDKLEAEVAGWEGEAHRLNIAIDGLKAAARQAPSFGGMSSAAIPAPVPISLAAKRVADPATEIIIAPRFVRPSPVAPPIIGSDMRYSVFPSASQLFVIDTAGHPASWRLVLDLVLAAAKGELSPTQSQQLSASLSAAAAGNGNGKKDASLTPAALPAAAAAPATELVRLVSSVGLTAAVFHAVTRHNPAVAAMLLHKVPAEATTVVNAMLDGLLEFNDGSAACTAGSVVLAAAKRMTAAHVAKYAAVGAAGVRASDATHRPELVRQLATTLHQLREKMPLQPQELSPALTLFEEYAATVAEVESLWGSELW